jgi:uncharacterized membrane protein YfhO
MNKSKKKLKTNSISTNSLPFFESLIEKYPLFIFLIISVIICFFIFNNFLTGKLLYFFKDIGSDTINISLANMLEDRHLAATHEGYAKLWSFYTGLGQAHQMPYSLNPASLLILLFKFIVGKNFFFYRIYYYLLIFIIPSGIFAFLFFRTLNINKFASIIGALFFEFSGYLIVGSQWGHMHEVLYFIFLLFAFEQFLIKKRWFYLPIAFYMLSDLFFSLLVNSVFLFLYSLLRYADVNNGSLRGYVRFLLKLAGFAIIGIVANAPRVIFTFLKMFDSPRVSGDVRQSKLLLLHPENINSYLRNVTTILRFYANDLLGAGSNFKGWYNYLEAPLFYIGLPSLILFPLSIRYFKNKQKIFYSIFLIFWLAVAFIPILRHSINFFVGNYYKISIDIFVPFTILFYAIYTLDKIISSEDINLLGLVITTGVLLVLLFFPYFKFTNAIVNFRMKLVISLFILFYTFIIVLYSSNKNKEIFYILFLGAVVFEIIYISRPSVNDRKVYTASELLNDYGGYKDATIDALKYIRKNDNSFFYRIEKDYSSGKTQHTSLNDAKAQGYFGTPTYGSFNQINYIKFLEATDIIKKHSESQTRWCTGVRGIPLLMTFVSVKYYLTKNTKNPLRYDGYDSLAYIKNILILKNKYFLPLGFTYKKYLPMEEYKSLSPFKKQEALLSAVVLDDNTKHYDLQKLDTTELLNVKKFNLKKYEKMIDSLKKEHFVINSFKNKKITGKIKISTDKILFFTIPYDKGWQIYINGKKEKLRKTNIGFCGIYLPKGIYKIKLLYRPSYLTFSLIIASFAMLFYIFLLFYKKDKK